MLEALPDAAQNPLALLGYLAAIAAWTFVAVRVRRNRNLLANLEKLPEGDRLRALQMEMGTVQLRSGLTANEWLRSQTIRYYFWAFIALCAVVVLVFAIASFNAKGHPPDPDYVQKRTVGDLDFGFERAYIVSKLGPPVSEAKLNGSDADPNAGQVGTCSYYEFEFAYVTIVYDLRNDVQFARVQSRRADFNPVVLPPSVPADYSKNWRLGYITFKDAQQDPIPTWFNEGAHTWTYTERVELAGSWNGALFLTYDAEGVNYKQLSDAITLGLKLPANEKEYAKLTKQEEDQLQSFRSKAVPNTYTKISGELLEKSGDDDVFGIRNGGETLTCED
jgi:hypothetical protein